MSYSDDEYTGYWTDLITPGIGAAWLLTAVFWSALFIFPKDNVLISFLVFIAMSLIALIFITPFMALGLSNEALAIALLVTLACVVIAMTVYGFRRQKPTALGIAGTLAISVAGFGATWFSFGQAAFG